MSQQENQKEDLSFWESIKILFGASKGFWLINMVNFVDGIAYFGILALLTIFLSDKVGMSDHLKSVSVSLFTGLVTLFMFGGGFVSDRLGVRKALTFSLVCIGVGRMLLTAAPLLTMYLPAKTVVWIALIIYAFGSGVLQPALYAGIKEYTDSRTATIGYGILYSIMNLGIIAESFVSPFVREKAEFLNLGFHKIIGLGWGVDGVFWMCTAMTGAVLLLHITFFTKKVETKECLYRTVDESKSLIEYLKEQFSDLPILDKRFMFFIFILLPVRTLFAHQFLTIPDYVMRCFPSEIGAKYEWISGLNPLIIVIGVPLITAFTMKSKVINMMIIGTLISALSTFLLVPGPNLTLLLVYVIIFSIGEACWSSRFLEFVADLAPAGRVGAYMGLAGIPWFLAKFTTGLYSGQMLEKFIPKTGAQNSGGLWLIYAFIAIASPIGLLLGKSWVEKAIARKR